MGKPQTGGKKAVKVKVLPKDPMVARRDGLWPVAVTVESPTVGDGPTSARVAVIDYNADLDVRFAPAKLLRDRTGFVGIAGKSDANLLESFTFHQINVWAIIEDVLSSLESEYALGRPIPWASGLGRLLVLPHAGYQENAFYDRGTGALHLFYFEGFDGKPVYTCLSHDIVAHELGHAILDGLKPGYNEVGSPETAGFHEYFGDAIAMLSSLRRRQIAILATKGAPMRLKPKNVVSAIASEFGAALHGLEERDYLRGAWQVKTMASVKGTFEEHDLSEVMTGIYYELLQHLYTTNLKEVLAEAQTSKARKKPDQGMAIRALYRAADQTSSVMLRALDYCPPVDLIYVEYARALLRAHEVAYPDDTYGIRAQLRKSFARRGLNPPRENARERNDITRKLRTAKDIEAVTATPADAYRFIDQHRNLFGIPYDANLVIASVYRTNKWAKSGYRLPKERIIEFSWSNDIELKGAGFGSLAGTTLPLYCGGTLVFDASGNFLHKTLVLPSAAREATFLKYVRYLIKEGSLGVSDGIRGIGAPEMGEYRVVAVVKGNRAHLQRNAAMRHSRPRGHHQ